MKISSSLASTCPCCLTAQTLLPSPAYTRCLCCGHRWRLPLETVKAGYYETLVARNDLKTPWFKRKIADRFAVLSALLAAGGRRVLEIGCAEGELGAAIKAQFSIVYDGVELSQDSSIAQQKLDQVFKTAASQVVSSPYDVIASFHVLEHIVDLEREILAWSSLLSPDGKLLIEVPNRSGHPLLVNDRNPEHLHQFTPASLAMVLARCGFSCHALSVGHYESPVYSDSIQVIAERSPHPDQQNEVLRRRFHERLGGPFIAYGIGGDFLNYVEPLADALDIRALVDSSSAKWGQQQGLHTITPYDPEQHSKLPILVCSIKFGAEIKQQLIGIGIAPERIIGLESIYEDA